MVILYADDDVDDLELFGDAVSKVDPAIVCVPVQSGEEALDFLHGDIFPDYVFLDINMPGMNGITCLTKIRANPKMKKLPVVILSTAASENDIDRFKALNADFISKPNSFDSLVKVISAFLLPRKH